MKITVKSKAAAACALLMLCSYAAFGQAPDGLPPGPPEDAPQGRMGHMPNPDRELNMLTRMLTLTPDQQKGVKAVLEQQATQMKALRNKAETDAATAQTPESREARMTQMKQIHEESSSKISALLDDTQRTRFAAWEQKRKESMERRGPHAEGDGNPPPPPPNE